VGQLKKIMEYLRPLYGQMLIGFIIKLAGTIMDLAIPWILAHMIDEVVPTGNKTAIFIWGAGMACCAVIALLGNALAGNGVSQPHRGGACAAR
jgi:ATP-binding cassette subfamily B multidrug efflux pump